MFLDRVGSTSWHNRHAAAFRRLDELLRAGNVREPTVMIVGPGGVTRLMAPLLNDSARERVSGVRKLIGDLARYGDQLLRRVPVVPMVSLEPLEVSRTLSMPHRLIVVDRSRRVLAAVSRDLPAVVVHCHDVAHDPIPAEADVVIAFNVVCRLPLELQADGMRHVAFVVCPGGLLLLDDRSARTHAALLEDFDPLAEKTYRRRAAV
ncbi:MAG TPA: hypothetical protein VNT79_15100 [Phycisphaerae bacterium]|nr:hypothetical protein [Phycisphaerae bacterium]